MPILKQNSGDIGKSTLGAREKNLVSVHCSGAWMQSASRPFPAFFRRFVQQQGADASQGPRAHPLLHVIWRPATTSNKTLRKISEEKNTQRKTVFNWILVKFMNNIHNFFLKFNCCKSEKGNLFSKVLLYFHGRVRWPQTPLQSHFGAENLISM